MITLQQPFPRRCFGLVLILHASAFTSVGFFAFPLGIVLPHFWVGLAMWWLIIDGFVQRVELDARGVRVVRLGRSRTYEWAQIRHVHVCLLKRRARGGVAAMIREFVVVPVLDLACGREVVLWPLGTPLTEERLRPRFESNLDSAAARDAARIREFGSHHNPGLLG